MNEYLLSIGITFVILLILAEITLIIKRIKINSRLERETKEEMKRIRKENERNRKCLRIIENKIEEISRLSNNHKIKKTFKPFLILTENYKALSLQNKEALSDEISYAGLGLFDDYFRKKLYSQARRVYDFLLKEVYPHIPDEKKEMIFLELKQRYELLMSTGLYNKRTNQENKQQS